MTVTAHVDRFAAENLPARELWPELVLDLADLSYPERLNCAAHLLDRQLAAGRGDRRCLVTADGRSWSYAELNDRANRIAEALTRRLGLVPGNRVLLRGFNEPMMVACWFGVLKAGGIAVATMPLLRARELGAIIEKAHPSLALCDHRLVEELDKAGGVRTVAFNGGELDRMMAEASGSFAAVPTAATDVAIIAFTSGTTGKPKGTMHFHRDILAMAETFSARVVKPTADDLFCGSPPVAFTYGLGGLVVFPIHCGAATLLLERAAPELLAPAIAEHRPTVLYTAPTAYRVLADLAADHDLSSLERCVSAGETLPLPTFEAFRTATGNRIIDGIGATEMLHIFIACSGDDIRPGATGKPVPGYRAQVIGEDGRAVAPGTVGRLAVKGPTGCRYLADDERQRAYVQDGWNLTGDAYRMDEDGYFWFAARTDDMIISAGYNIAGPEVEEALLAHPAVRDCAVIGAPDPARGFIVKAFVVLRDGRPGDTALIKELQDFVKREIAPYKYPRAVEFLAELPRTGTGKVQRFVLREQEKAKAAPGAAP